MNPFPAGFSRFLLRQEMETPVYICMQFTIDLLAKACDVSYLTAQHYIQNDEIDGVKIPYLKPELLIKTKMGIRPKDIQDRNFLQQLLSSVHP